MVTDPPYGVNYDPNWRLRVGVNKKHQKLASGKVENDHEADWSDAWALFPGNVAYIWHGGLHAHTVAENLIKAGYEIKAQIIWAKPSLVIGRGNYHWQHEPCWYAVKAGAKHNYVGDRKQTTLWHIENMHSSQGSVDDGKTNHSTQKPVACMQRPIVNNSEAGDTVYDPFCGSGTTVIACEVMKRKCAAIELNPIYVDMIIRRWQKFTGKQAVFEPTGQPFDDHAKKALSNPSSRKTTKKAKA